MEYYELHPDNPQKRYISKAVETLKEGGVIIYPTDTVYGLGCDIFNKEAVERIYMIKNETDTKLFSFLCSDLKDISKYAKVSDFAYKSMRKLLPGPYTFVLPAAKEVPKKLWTKRKTVGIRVPNNEIARTLAFELGNPIVSTSATTRKGETLFDPLEIRTVFNNSVDLMLSMGALTGVPSSIVDLSGDEIEIIREGSGDLSLFY
ncbi:MAG: threonylcarbamoyl-AMP synthase [Ignavibacteriae bacterium]|nr:threonylcarbamoyl-AMP synthase [Ignavibacteriota bacterium]MCB9209510.1 threonylcarbamoyl-AMP synthase [Ignavibacteriales bacterium]MCB9258153.1 threonylcarbamoyl-AMP synthase [Ignavibacteriales bacterium]